MATKTSGTLATTTLTCIQWYPGFQGTNSTNATDFATIAAGVFADCGPPLGSFYGNAGPGNDGMGNKAAAILQGAVSPAGVLTLPGGRGTIQLVAGDWMGVDGFGNLFAIPQRALPRTLTLANCTTVTTSPAIAFASDVRVLGWQNGTHITGTNVPNNSIIGDLATTGLTANLYSAVTGLKVNATGSASNITFTAGSFTHS